MTKEPAVRLVRLNEVLLEDGWHGIADGSDGLAGIWAHDIDDNPIDVQNSRAVRYEFVERTTDAVYYVAANHLYAMRGEVVEETK